MGMGELGKRVASPLKQRAKRDALQADLQRTQAERDALQADLQRTQAERDVLQAVSQEQRSKREAREAKLQKWQIITSIATAATVVVAAVAIILGYASLKQQENSAASQDQESRYSSLYQLYLDVDKEIAGYPRLVPCFRNTNCPTALTAADRDQAYALAVYVVDLYQYLYNQLRNLGYGGSSGLFVLREDATLNDNESWITWSQTIFYGFKYSKEECQALIDSRAAYGQDFVQAVAVTGVCPSLPDPWA
jgi:hypothetical protein